MFHLEAVKLARVGAREGVLGSLKGRSYYGECLTSCFEVCILKPEKPLGILFLLCALIKQLFKSRLEIYIVAVSLSDIWLWLFFQDLSGRRRDISISFDAFGQ